MQPQLVRWFENARVPRYTSYPTAPHFNAKVDAETHAAWLRAIDPDEPVSVYLHVPYCRVLCWYCGCTTRVTQDQGRIDAYAAVLEQELELVAGLLPKRMPMAHLHWGGGTPTVLGAAGFSKLMEAVHRRFAATETAELAIEIDPRTVNEAMLDAIAASGITRASLGVQSFDPKVQRAINRIQSYETTAKVIEGLRRRGVPGINVDLLYGLPHQTIENCIETIRLVSQLRPDRIAIFGYAHVPGFKKHQELIDVAALPDAAGRVAQYEAMAEALEAHGFGRIGLDHFALPHDPMAKAAADGTLRRNFQGYTTDQTTTLIGLGASSISSLKQGYAQNHVELPPWRDAIAKGRLPTHKGIALSESDRIQREIIDALMCRGEVDLGFIAQSHGIAVSTCAPDPERFDLVERLGIAKRDGDRIQVDPDARPLLRVVAAAFDRYLSPEATRHSAAV